MMPSAENHMDKIAAELRARIEQAALSLASRPRGLRGPFAIGHDLLEAFASRDEELARARADALEEADIESDRPIHDWFGLTHSSYFVVPRLAMQEMPVGWQKRFLALVSEMEAVIPETPDYHVLRDDPAYTLVKNYDEDDDTSRPYEFTAVYEDPWANYRRGRVADLVSRALSGKEGKL